MGSCRIGMISLIDKTGIKAYDIAFLNNMVFSWNSMNNFVVDRYTDGCRIALIIQEIRFAAKAADGLFSDFINLRSVNNVGYD